MCGGIDAIQFVENGANDVSVFSPSSQGGTLDDPCLRPDGQLVAGHDVA